MRFIEPVKPRDADGLVAEIYGEIRRDFGLLRDPAGNSPFLVHSVHPELLAAMWSGFYETVLVEGTVRRADKEAIGTTVSRINGCPFCLDAHALLADVAAGTHERDALRTGTIGGVADERTRQLVAWASASRQPGHELVRCPPFGERQTPEVVGTAVAFHYVNRLVEIFQGHRSMSTGRVPRVFVRALVGQLAGRAMRRPHQVGRTLHRLPDAELPPDLNWARAAPAVASAHARWAAAVERAGQAALPEPARERVDSIVAKWDGNDPPLHSDWLQEVEFGLDAESQAAAHLAALAALAPYRLGERDVERFRRIRSSDRDLVGAVAWAAFTAARRIGSWLGPAGCRLSELSAPPTADSANESRGRHHGVWSSRQQLS
jgi:AhpD family alkylhydroperoxidase